MSFEQRHLVRIREMLDNLNGAIAADEARGATPSRKYARRSALEGVIRAAAEHLQLRNEVQKLQAEVAQLRAVVGEVLR